MQADWITSRKVGDHCLADALDGREERPNSDQRFLSCCGAVAFPLGLRAALELVADIFLDGGYADIE